MEGRCINLIEQEFRRKTFPLARPWERIPAAGSLSHPRRSLPSAQTLAAITSGIKLLRFDEFQRPPHHHRSRHLRRRRNQHRRHLSADAAPLQPPASAADALADDVLPTTLSEVALALRDLRLQIAELRAGQHPPPPPPPVVPLTTPPPAAVSNHGRPFHQVKWPASPSAIPSWADTPTYTQASSP